MATHHHHFVGYSSHLVTAHDLPQEFQGAVLAIGNFDGIHLGHQSLFALAMRRATEKKRPCGVLSFDPHPRAFFVPDSSPFRLTPLPWQSFFIKQTGVDFHCVQEFSTNFSTKTALEFLDYLYKDLRAAHVVVGENFHFGAARQGDVQMLVAYAKAQGKGVDICPILHGEEHDIYSSTAIRQALQAGDMHKAAQALGRYWEIDGMVIHGDKRGRKLGFATANIALGSYLRPAFGIYAVRINLPARGSTWYEGVANLGVRPHYPLPDPLLEAHIFDFDADIYGADIRVMMIERLRGEEKFANLEELTTQIAHDCQNARRILAKHPRKIGKK